MNLWIVKFSTRDAKSLVSSAETVIGAKTLMEAIQSAYEQLDEWSKHHAREIEVRPF